MNGLIQPSKSVTSSTSRFLSVMALGVASLASRGVHAQAKDPAAARMLFQEARAAAEANNFSVACPKFEDSYKLEPAPGTLLNIAECDRRAGRIATAWAKFQTAIELLPPNDERRPGVQQYAADLEKRLPRLSVTIKSDAPADTTIERDGVPVGKATLGSALPVDPGVHVFIFRASGRKDQRYEISIAEAERKDLIGEPGPSTSAPLPPAAVPPVAAPAAPATQPQPVVAKVEVPQEPAKPAPPVETPTPNDEQKRANAARTGTYVLGGVGGVGILAGAVMMALAVDKKSTADTNCPNKACNTTGWDAVESGKNLQTAGLISLGVGAAAAVGAIALHFGSAPIQKETGVAFIPSVSPDGGFLSLTRRF